MEFFGMGLGEIALILILALIVFGPGRIPEIARTIGKAMRTLKTASSEFTTTLNRELNIEEQKAKQAAESKQTSDAKQVAEAKPTPEASQPHEQAATEGEKPQERTENGK